MRNRIGAALAGAIAVITVGAGLYWTLQSGSSERAAVPGGGTGAGTGPARLLLNEIVFRPVAGESAWVELVNAGGEPAVTDDLVLVNQARERLDLPRGIEVPSRGVLLVRFDGATRAEGLTIHSDRAAFLHQETGSIDVVAGNKTVDSAYWATSGGASFSLGRGGRVPAFVAGTSLGRPRGSMERGPAAWTVFDPSDTTPGQSNGVPAVAGLMPLSGASLRTATPTLSWYGVPTARRYRVQIATDRSFEKPVFDRVIDASGRGIEVQQITAASLPPGAYVWRAGAIFDGMQSDEAAFSAAAILRIDAKSNAAARRSIRELLASLTEVPAFASQTAGGNQRVLPVPFIMQRKDTALLSLEADEDGDKPWDRPWAPRILAPTCARAAIAMIAAYYKGNVSQDRLNYELQKDWGGIGPRMDLDVRGGWMDDAITKGLRFALGVDSTRDFSAEQVNQHRSKDPGFDFNREYWRRHREAIDQGIPVLATTRGHAFVIVGYGEDSRGPYLVVNDPAYGQYDWFLPTTGDDRGDLPNTGAVDTSFFPLPGARGTRDEPELASQVDTDGDGILDFDERRRFGTNPSMKDSDQDGIEDKREIRAWVFDERIGYWPRHDWAWYSDSFADQDEDKRRMEVDEDSDGGGCTDGLEDVNANGVYEAALKELDNFERDDDPCIVGEFKKIADYTFASPGTRGEYHERQSTTLSLMPQPDGTLTGIARAAYEMSNLMFFDSRGGCRGSTTVPHSEWTSEMHGQSRTLPDGTIEVTFEPVSSPPSLPVHARDECPPGSSITQSMPAPFSPSRGPYALVNGRYTQGGELPPPPQPGATGNARWELTVELKRAQR